MKDSFEFFSEYQTIKPKTPYKVVVAFQMTIMMMMMMMIIIMQ